MPQVPEDGSLELEFSSFKDPGQLLAFGFS